MKVPATSTLTWWCAMGRLGVTLTRAGELAGPHHVTRRAQRFLITNCNITSAPAATGFG